MEFRPRRRPQIGLHPGADAQAAGAVRDRGTLARSGAAGHRCRHHAAQLGFAALAGSRRPRWAGAGATTLSLAAEEEPPQCPGGPHPGGAAGVDAVDHRQRQDRGRLSVHPDEGQGSDPDLLHELLPGREIMGETAGARSGGIFQPFAPAHQAEISLSGRLPGARYLENAGAQEPGRHLGLSGHNGRSYSGAVAQIRYFCASASRVFGTCISIGATGRAGRLGRTHEILDGGDRNRLAAMASGRPGFDLTAGRGGVENKVDPFSHFMPEQFTGSDPERRAPWGKSVLAALGMAVAPEALADDGKSAPVEEPAAITRTVEDVRAQMRNCKAEVTAAGKSWVIEEFKETGLPRDEAKAWLAKQRRDPDFIAGLKEVKAKASSECGAHNRALRREETQIQLAMLDEEWQARQEFYAGMGLKLRENEEGTPVLYVDVAGKEELFAVIERDPEAGEIAWNFSPAIDFADRAEAFNEKVGERMWELIAQGDVEGLKKLFEEAEAAFQASAKPIETSMLETQEPSPENDS